MNTVLSIYIHLWLYSPLLDLGLFLSFLIVYTVSKIPRTRDQPVARRYLHTNNTNPE
jgi:hypothetical protein